MFETHWTVNGKDIRITTDYLGDEPALWNEENYNRNEIAVSIDDGPEEIFYSWGSIVHPQFDDEYSAKNAFQQLVNEGLYILWDQIDELTDGMSYAQGAKVVAGCQEIADKLVALGLTDDDMEKIANDADWQ